MVPINIDVFGMEPQTNKSEKDGGEDGKNVLDWRQYIEEKATPMIHQLDNRLFGKTARFAVDLEFSLTSAREMDTDLDNLAKPVLDTLFQDPKNKSGYPSGVLFKCNDSQVIKLHIAKTTVQEQDKLGVRIQVTCLR